MILIVLVTDTKYWEQSYANITQYDGDTQSTNHAVFMCKIWGIKIHQWIMWNRIQYATGISMLKCQTGAFSFAKSIIFFHNFLVSKSHAPKRYARLE